MKAVFTDFTASSHWVKGQVAEFHFNAKLFDEPSEWGINDGRVSKLSIWEDGEEAIVNFDRGWDIEPLTARHKMVFEAALNLLENSPQRFV